jgi:hypothetical protein
VQHPTHAVGVAEEAEPTRGCTSLGELWYNFRELSHGRLPEVENRKLELRNIFNGLREAGGVPNNQAEL